MKFLNKSQQHHFVRVIPASNDEHNFQGYLIEKRVWRWLPFWTLHKASFPTIEEAQAQASRIFANMQKRRRAPEERT